MNEGSMQKYILLDRVRRKMASVFNRMVFPIK